MVVVVPALAHGEEGEDPVVAAVVARHIDLVAMHMRQRIDAEGRVIQRDRGPEEAHEQAAPARDQIAEHGEHDGGGEFEAVQKAQLRIFRKILDLHEIGRIVAAGEDPADMGIEKALVARGVDVRIRIGKQVVMAVLGRPPQHALLRGGLRDPGQHELEDAARLVAAMRKVAMIATRHAEHAEPVEADAQQGGLPGHAAPDRAETGEMGTDERNHMRIHDVVVLVGRRLGVRVLMRH